MNDGRSLKGGVMGLVTPAETSSIDVVARGVLQELEDSWNRGDGRAFGEVYAEDATFVNIRGDYAVGRDAIAAGHAAIFATTHAGSVNRMELITSREIADDVVVMVSRNELTAPVGPLRGRHSALSTSTLVCTAGQWQIAATHNALVGAL